MSEVEPEGSVGEHAAKRHHAPHHLVTRMSLRANHKVLQLVHCRNSWEHLASILSEVDHVEHHLGRLFLVRQLHDQ